MYLESKEDAVADKATEVIAVNASPDLCWNVVADVESYPQWANDIKEVRVLSSDQKGRPSEVLFRAAAYGRSTSYTLKYDYSKAPGELSWIQTAGDLTNKLDGRYIFSGDTGSTTVTYELTAELKIPLPGFVKRRAETRIIHTALKELKARVESAG